MSKKDKKKKDKSGPGEKKKSNDPTPAERIALVRRRILVGLYLLFLVGCFVGTQGTWWRVFIGDKQVGDPMTGPRYLRYSPAPPEDDPAADPMKTQVVENPVRPMTIAVAACVVAFFFASFNLVSDGDLQLPVFLATVALVATGGYVLYGVWVDQEVIREVVALQERDAVRTELIGQLKAAGLAPDGVATVDSAAAVPAERPQVILRFAWGLALFLSSTLVMFIDSLFLTFIAQRAGEKP